MKKLVSLLLCAALLTACLLAAGCTVTPSNNKEDETVDFTLTVAMECAYAPYNWTQTDDANGAVPIKGATGEYANGYDVMMAKKICEANGWQLEVVRLDWDSLVPAVQTGQVDAVIAGQSMTAERAEQVDFAGPYLYASIVALTRQDSPVAGATKLADLAGASCTSQMGTVWYDICLPQIEGADIKAAKDSAPTMLMALETGDVDFVCTDMPTAQGALVAYPDMKILELTDGFNVSEEEINIGISVQKGNTALKDKINAVLAPMTEDDFNAMMAEATKIQPLSQD
ncbi:MAG: transporter substrate-binding domain-containing protein [Clostridia bacterium]|nr:transporter substrate-binding domain-containing protein [Clostridia bacterium]